MPHIPPEELLKQTSALLRDAAANVLATPDNQLSPAERPERSPISTKAVSLAKKVDAVKTGSAADVPVPDGPSQRPPTEDLPEQIRQAIIKIRIALDNVGSLKGDPLPPVALEKLETIDAGIAALRHSIASSVGRNQS